MNESHFSTWLFCLLNSIYTSTMCSWNHPAQKTKNLPNFSNVAFWEKGWTITHEKCYYLFDMAFLVKQITNLTSNLTWRTLYISSNESYQERWVWWTDYRLLRPLKSVAVLELSLVFRQVCNTYILHFWYHSIDIHSIFLHMEFEDGLSIQVMRKGQLFTKIYSWKSKSLKKVKPPAHFISNPALSNSRAIGQDWAYRCMSGFPSWIFKRVKSWRWFQVGFICWTRLWLCYM
jgi:hypothetical protein